MVQNPAPQKCYTIGYGDYPIDLFIYFLQHVGIDTIIDVRSSPYSKYNPYFNRDNLENSLKKNNIDYQFMGNQIGGRYSNPNLLYPDGTVNYQKVQSTETFQEGINRLLTIILSGKKIALMCAEKEPERCHRFALISRVLQSKKIKVTHIRPEIKLQTNEDLENELIKTTIDNRQQNISDIPVNAVDSMYERLNKKIAYKIKDYHQSSEEIEMPDYPVHVPALDPEKKKEELSEIQYVSEPGFPSSHTLGIVQGSDSFTEKHVKKPVQKTLF